MREKILGSHASHVAQFFVTYCMLIGQFSVNKQTDIGEIYKRSVF